MNFVTDIKFRCNIRPKRSIDVRQSLVSGLWTPVVRVSIMLSLMPAMLHIQCFRLVQIQKQQQQQQRNRNYHCYSYVMFSVSVMIASAYWLWTCTHKITGVYAMYVCVCCVYRFGCSFVLLHNTCHLASNCWRYYCDSVQLHQAQRKLDCHSNSFMNMSCMVCQLYTENSQLQKLNTDFLLYIKFDLLL